MSSQTSQPGWVQSATGEVSYPPAPWDMVGSLWLTLFRLREPVDELRPAGVYGAAFVSYEEGSPLTYSELLVARPISTDAYGRRVSITDIWVDSPESVAGGRELWAIPKGLARFERRDGSASVEVEGRTAASLEAWTGGRVLPGWQSFTLTTAQRLEGRTVLATNAARAHARRATIGWDFPADGPLAYMADGRALFSVELDQMGISFGLSCRRS